MRLVIDVTQLKVSRFDTGIERVVRKLALAIAESDSHNVALINLPPTRLRAKPYFVALDEIQNSNESMNVKLESHLTGIYQLLEQSWHKIDRSPLKFLVNNRFSILAARLILSKILRKEKNQSQEFIFTEKDTLLLMGSFWSKKSLSLARKAKKSGSELVVILNDLTPVSHPTYCSSINRSNFLRYAREVIDLADKVCYPTIHTKNQIDNFWPGVLLGKMHVKLNYGHDSFGITQQISSKRRVRDSICVLGTIEPRKNSEIVLDWFMSHADADTTLTFIGRPGWLTERFQKRLLENSQLNSRIRWLSHLGDKELSEELSLHELGVLASHEEGFGLPVVEMNSAGLKLVLSDIPVFREVAGDSAEFFDRNSVHSLNEAIIRARSRTERAFIKEVTWADSARDLLEFLRAH